MNVTTESGAVYTIRRGICEYRGSHGEYSFKITEMRPIDGNNPPESWEALHALPQGEPEIGKHLYVGGLWTWRLSTKVVSITYEDGDE